MKILGMGFPEMLIILCTMAIPILIVVVIVRAIVRRRNPVDETQRASAASSPKKSSKPKNKKSWPTYREDPPNLWPPGVVPVKGRMFHVKHLFVGGVSQSRAVERG